MSKPKKNINWKPHLYDYIQANIDQGLSVKQIAEKMNLTPNEVYQACYRKGLCLNKQDLRTVKIAKTTITQVADFVSQGLSVANICSYMALTNHVVREIIRREGLTIRSGAHTVSEWTHEHHRVFRAMVHNGNDDDFIGTYMKIGTPQVLELREKVAEEYPELDIDDVVAVKGTPYSGVEFCIMVAMLNDAWKYTAIGRAIGRPRSSVETVAIRRGFSQKENSRSDKRVCGNPDSMSELRVRTTPLQKARHHNAVFAKMRRDYSGRPYWKRSEARLTEMVKSHVPSDILKTSAVL